MPLSTVAGYHHVITLHNLLTQHLQESLQVWPGTFLIFLVGHGDKASTSHLLFENCGSTPITGIISMLVNFLWPIIWICASSRKNNYFWSDAIYSTYNSKIIRSILRTCLSSSFEFGLRKATETHTHTKLYRTSIVMLILPLFFLLLYFLYTVQQMIPAIAAIVATATTPPRAAKTEK